MDETELQQAVDGTLLATKENFADEGVDVHSGDTPPPPDGLAPDMEHLMNTGVIRTLDGEIAGDEFSQDAMNYQILLGKIDRLLDSLKLDA